VHHRQAAGILATLERICRVACDSEQDNRGAGEFLAFMRWLPELIRDLEAGRAQLDA